jgi:F-type H+-transporting ATPase subunit b
VNMNATLIGQAIAFAVFIWFCMKYVWPPVMAAIAERQKKIAEGLNAADKAQRDLEQAHAQVAEELKAAKVQAAALIEQANKRANQMVEEAKGQAAAEGQRLLAQAREQIEQEMAAARDTLRGQVAGLAVAGAEKILEAQVDAKVHAAMLDKLAQQL